ncbi:MAG TPA: sugar ABC transporter permease [Spirochaetia bacterium]|nr:sugar ABC transporter permease [Spirochaetia bacterium]
MSFGTLDRQKSTSGLIMVAPSMAILALFVLWPIVQSAYLSLFDWNLLSNKQQYIGLANYAAILGDSRFWNALWTTFYYTAMYVPGLVLVALVLALALDQKVFGRKVLRPMFFLPSITSMAIIAIVWRFILDPDVGLVSSWLSDIGVTMPDMLRNSSWSLPTIAGVSIWRWAGFNMVILLAGLNTIPDSYYEAANLDGAGAFRKLYSVTMPLLLPSLSFVVVTNIIASFQVFDPVYVMTKGGPLFSTEVMVYYIYYEGFTLYKMGYASALAYVLFIVIFLFTLLQLRGFVRGEERVGY